MVVFIALSSLISLVALLAFKLVGLRALWRKEIGAKSKGKRYIYVFRGRYEWFWLVKIGKAKDIYQRMSQHKTAGSPFGIHVIAVIKVTNEHKAEDVVHARFDAEHFKNATNGREWYWYSIRMIAYFLIVKDYALTKQVKARY